MVKIGYVTIAGLWEPGTQVRLYQVAGDHEMRAERGALVGHRIANEHGTVGFDGIEVGARLIAVGYEPNGRPLEVRALGLAEDEASELAQPPLRPELAKRGTQEETVKPSTPGEPFAILHTGVPDGLAA